MKLIPLSTTGKNKGKYFAQVDDEDYERVITRKWHSQIHRNDRYVYAKTNSPKGRELFLHSFIIGAIAAKSVIDHEDHDGLNCQRSNLRVATISQNAQNRIKKQGSSKFLGVCWHKRAQKWLACITVNYKQIYIGLYEDEIEAAKAYDKRAKELFGEFANPNFK